MSNVTTSCREYAPWNKHHTSATPAVVYDNKFPIFTWNNQIYIFITVIKDFSWNFN